MQRLAPSFSAAPWMTIQCRTALGVASRRGPLWSPGVIHCGRQVAVTPAVVTPAVVTPAVVTPTVVTPAAVTPAVVTHCAHSLWTLAVVTCRGCSPRSLAVTTHRDHPLWPPAVVTAGVGKAVHPQVRRKSSNTLPLGTYPNGQVTKRAIQCDLANYVQQDMLCMPISKLDTCRFND